MIPPFRFFVAFEPVRPFIRAQRALAAAAIFARAAVDIRRLPPRRGAVVGVVSLTKALSRLSSASIWRRIDKACSRFRVDKSISHSDKIKFSLMQGISYGCEIGGRAGLRITEIGVFKGVIDLREEAGPFWRN